MQNHTIAARISRPVCIVWEKHSRKIIFRWKIGMFATFLSRLNSCSPLFGDLVCINFEWVWFLFWFSSWTEFRMKWNEMVLLLPFLSSLLNILVPCFVNVRQRNTTRKKQQQAAKRNIVILLSRMYICEERLFLIL